MRRGFKLICAIALLWGGAGFAQDEVHLAIEPEATSPLPIQMALDPYRFHAALVTPTGQLRLGFSLMSVGGRGWPMTLNLGYYPSSQNVGFGDGFGFSFGVILTRDVDTGSLLIQEEDGTTSAYARLRAGEFEAVSGTVSARVYAFEDGNYERIFASGMREVFDAHGRLTQRIGDTGDGYRLAYDDAHRPVQIIHDDGQQINIGWSDGLITHISHPLAGRFSYHYENNRLSEIIDPLGRRTTFQWDGAGRLTLLTLADSQTLAVDYDDNDLVSELAGPGALVTRFSHWNDPLARRMVQTVTDAANYTYRLEIGVSPTAPDTQQIISVDPAGNTTVRDIIDGQVDVSINGTWVGAALNDAGGQATALLTPSGMVELPSSHERAAIGAMPDGRGFPRHVSEGGAASWLDYDALGRVIARAGSDGVIERYTYDEGGRLVAFTRGNSWHSAFTYDQADRLLERRDSDGGWERFSYTDEGWPSGFTSDQGQSIAITYGPAGRVHSLDDGQSTWAVTYSEAGLLLEMRADSGMSLGATYDELGRLLALRDVNGLVTLLPDGPLAPIADNLGRLRGDITINGEAAFIGDGGAISTYRLADNGDTIVETTNPDGEVLIERIAPEGALVSADLYGSRPSVVRTDIEGQITIMGDPENPSIVEYDDAGRVARRISPQGIVTELTHDENGNLTAISSPLDGVDISVNAAGQPIALTLRDGSTVTQELDAEGRPVRYSMTDPLGMNMSEQITYDANGQIAAISADGMGWQREYAPTSSVTTLSAGDVQQVWLEETDPETGNVTLTGPDGTQTLLTFDAAGRLLSSVSPSAEIYWELDVEGVPIAVTIDGHRKVLTGDTFEGAEILSDNVYEPETPQAVARVITLKDLRDQVWEMRFDGHGNLVARIDPRGGETSYAFDSFGNMVERVDAEGRSFYAITDEMGRETEAGVAGGWAVARGYDGNVAGALTYSGGTSVLSRLDETTGTLVAEIDGDVTTQVWFDSAGSFLSANDALGAVSSSYGDGRLIARETNAFGQSLQYSYDAIGRAEMLALPNGQSFTYSRSADGLVQTGPDGQARSARYSPEESRYYVELADGTEAVVTLAAGHVLAQIALSAGDARLNYSVSRDILGGVTEINRNGSVLPIARDALGRVITTGFGELAFDGSGNVVGAPEGDRAFDIAFRQSSGPLAATYDADGRQLTAGDTRFTYDPVGRLTGVSAPGKPDILLRYDALGRLAERVTDGAVERFLWQGDDLVGVYDAAGATLVIIERNALYPGLVTLHLTDRRLDVFLDQAGTPVLGVEAGSLHELADWSLWGAPSDTIADWARWLGFAGRPTLPDYGLTLFHHRAYSGFDRRFLTPDPAGIHGSDNPYSYADNDPATFTDMLGLNSAPFAIGPRGLSPANLPFDIPGIQDGASWTSATQRRIETFLRQVANGPPSPTQRVARETLDGLLTPGLRLRVNEAITANPRLFGAAGGSAAVPTLEVNSGNILRHTRNGLAGARNAAAELRAVASVYVHEITHILQRQLYPGGEMGRVWREVEAGLRQSLFDPPHGGFGFSNRNPVEAARRVADYALSTQFRAYLPSDHPSALSPHLNGRRVGLRQMSASQFADLAQRYLPGVDRATLMREFRAARSAAQAAHTRQISDYIRNQQPVDGVRRAAPGTSIDAARRTRPSVTAPHTTRPTLDSANANRPRIGGPRGVDVEPPRVRRPDGVPISSNRTALDATRARTPAVDAPSRTRPTLDAPNRARPRLAPDMSLRPTAAPDAPRVRATGPAADAPRNLRRNPVTLDAARGTRPTLDAARNARTPVRQPRTRLQADTFEARDARSQTRPRPTADAPRAPHNMRGPSSVDPSGPRPNANLDQAARGSRAATRPSTPEPRAPGPRPQADAPRTGGADGPRAPRTPAPDVPRAPAPDTPRTGGLDTPRPVDPPARPLRPTRTGSLSPPDLSTGATTRPPRVNAPDGVRLPHGPVGHGGVRVPSLGGVINGGFIAWDIYNSVVDTDRYLRGEIGHQEYWTNIALSLGGNFAPWPINGAIMAHQLGKFAGSWAASKLLEAYRNGDPVARALVNWFRKNGWINANDPTFVALPEQVPGRFGSGRLFSVRQGDAVAIPLSLWSPIDDAIVIVARDATGAEIARLQGLLFRGLTHMSLDPGFVATLETGTYEIALEDGFATPDRPILTLDIIAPDYSIAEPGETEPAPKLIVEAGRPMTRLNPTDLPWSRFDRPGAVLDGPFAGLDAFGIWQWQEAQDGTNRQVHLSTPVAPPLHYALLSAPLFLAPGEHIVQYLWIDPDAPPAQILMQFYDEDLSGAHRLNMGADLIAVDGRIGEAFVQAGDVPATGRWWRIKIPVNDIGMGGRSLAGIGFAASDGRVLWGPTRLSGPDDRAPMRVVETSRDESGAPEADLRVSVGVQQAGMLSLNIARADGSLIPLFEGQVFSGNRVFWWQGAADLLSGAEVLARITPETGAQVSTRVPIDAGAALVAQILFPPEGAVVRQTVPIFGQAGGHDFASYTVEYRARGTGEEGWLMLNQSQQPSLVTQAEIDARIATILAQQLRSTVYGNLASLDTGSALHNFEFAPENPVLASGWIELRLTVTDQAGNARSDTRLMRVGEVADGQTQTAIASPDGGVTLAIPPLSLPAGMGALSIDLAADSSVASSPAPLTPVYEMAPSGLDLAAPVALRFTLEDGQAPPVSVIMQGRDGDWQALSTTLEGNIATALIEHIEFGARFYLAAVQAPETVPEVPLLATLPWFDGQTERVIGTDADALGAELLAGPIRVDGPTVLQLTHAARSWRYMALVLRSGTEARVVPLGRDALALSSTLAAVPAGLSADGTQRLDVIRLDGVFDRTVTIDRIDLVRVTSAAWRTFVARPVEGREIGLVSALAGPLATARPAPYAMPTSETWELVGAESQDIAALADGVHRFTLTRDAGNAHEFGLLVDTTPPVLTPRTPAPDAPNAQLAFTLSALDEGAGLNPTSVRVTLNTQPVPADMVRVSASGDITVRFAQMISALNIAPGDTLTASVQISDRFENAAEPATWSWVYRPEAIAIDIASQLTLDGAGQATWGSSSDHFYYLGLNEGQPDYVHYTRADGVATPLGVPFTPSGQLRVHSDGRMLAADTNDMLHYYDGTTWHSLDVSGRSPSWDQNGGIIFARGNMIMLLAEPDSVPAELCQVSAGATIESPTAFDGAILFTQVIYHRTVWRCDPETGTTSLLRGDESDPDLRDTDIRPFGPDMVYARDGGQQGLWRLSTGGAGETPLLPADFAANARRPELSPDGTMLLFESDFSGRSEIWSINLVTGFELSVQPTAIRTDQPTDISVVLDGVGANTIVAVRIVAEDGSMLAQAEGFGVEGAAWSAPAGLPEGPAQVEVELSSGLTLRAPIVVDGTAPLITIRNADTGAVLPADQIAADVSVVVTAEDAGITQLYLRDENGSLTLIENPVRISELPSGASVVARDSAGNESQVALAVQSAAAPVAASPDTEESPQTGNASAGNSALLWLVLLLIGAGAIGVVLLVRRRLHL